MCYNRSLRDSDGQYLKCPTFGRNGVRSATCQQEIWTKEVFRICLRHLFGIFHFHGMRNFRLVAAEDGFPDVNIVKEIHIVAKYANKGYHYAYAK